MEVGVGASSRPIMQRILVVELGDRYGREDCILAIGIFGSARAMGKGCVDLYKR